MKAPKFDYIKAESRSHALELLDQLGEDGRILAGGQSLMPTLNMRLSQPGTLIDINKVSDLSGITLEDGVVHIGAMTRHVEVATSPIVAKHLPLIAEAMKHVAHHAVRNRGTIGGSVALADPAAEMPACILALGATLVVESINGRREIAADDYFKGLYETAREPNELLVEILIPSKKTGEVSVFLELAQRHGDFAMAGLACVARVSNKTFEELRLVYFGSEDRPTIGTGAIAAVIGQTCSDECKEAAAIALANDLDPMTNLQGSAAMKLHLQKVLTGRALDTAVERAEAT
ncbi:MAG: xanthine dehydrogenase family protein subunit M [Alphaproteobacteria bacterium]|nr:xanthine dehydrogenase family protein subunit M [Alphaproteobacteria bacterium]